MTEQLTYYFSLTFFGNTLLGYTQAAGLFVVLYLVLMFVQRSVMKHLMAFANKTESDIDDFVIRTFSSVKPHFYSYLSLYVALQLIDVAPFIDRVADVILLVVVVFQIIQTTQIVIRYAIDKRFASDSTDETRYAAGFLGGLVKWILWFVGGLLILQNLGINITSLIAGLGIGGIAIAFALQNILGDLFASLAIYLDKPFVVGDIIKVGEHTGEVAAIGIKTTRIRSLVGEEIVISNNDLLSSRIQNFKKLEKRRAVFSIGVLYETPTDLLEQIPSIVEGIINQSGAEFARAHFKSFGDSSLNFEIVYFVESNDYDEYVALEHTINMSLHKTFNEKGIEFAYPTVFQYNKAI